MARYFVSKYAYIVPLPKGKLAVRVMCPTCGHIHAGIAHGGDSVCQGCGQELCVRGAELLTGLMPSSWFREEADEAPPEQIPPPSHGLGDGDA